MQCGPDVCRRAEHQKAHAFPAVSEREHEQPRTTVLAGFRIAHHGAGAVIDLCFLTGSCLNHRASFRRYGHLQLVYEALDALIARTETASIDQVLPDRHGIAAT